ncbi:MAG: hypothetical protein AMK73_04860 [Planctomycetes bacterium SM23_32]|nr:MAG: hypothetical protein AMK73_04860 [Planctomycetes bacterium SM23_32]
MISSMTGFGAAEAQREGWTVVAEARSVNHKDLRLALRLPDAFQARQFEVQKLVEERLHRGHVYVEVTCRTAEGGAGALVDREQVRSYAAALREVAEAEGLPFQVDLASVLRLPGAVKDMTTDEDLRERLWPGVLEACGAALDALAQMRRTEGANLEAQLAGSCEAIESLTARIEAAQQGLVAAYRDRLRQRVERLLDGAGVPVNEESLAREVALFADRSDVSEEVVRLRSHLAQFGEALTAEGPVGRKMEFLGQEMLREANTMAAKMASGPPVRDAVELKSEIDRLREQVRNVE